jgi:hypothetical protein
VEKLWPRQDLGARLQKNYFPGAYLQENRDLNIIMHINQGSIAQKNLTRTSGWKNKEAWDLNEKIKT